MGSFSIWHWLIVLLIVVLVFGTKKLKNIGTDLGGAVKGFKDGVRDGTSRRPIRRLARSRSSRHGRSIRAPSTWRRKRSRDRLSRASALPGRAGHHDRFRLRQDRPDRRGRTHRDRAREAAAGGPHRRHLLGKAQRYVADVKAEVNRSIELEDLKKMKTEFEDAARNVEQHGLERDPAALAPTSARPGRPRSPTSRPTAATHDGPVPPAAVQAPEEELAPEARCDAAVVQAEGRRARQGPVGCGTGGAVPAAEAGRFGMTGR